MLGICVTMGNVVVGFNASASNVALDGIARSLTITDGDLQWVATSFLLVFVSPDYLPAQVIDD